MTAQLDSAFRFVGMATDEKWMKQYLSSRSNNVRLVICDDPTQQLVSVVYLLNIDWLHRNAECAIWIGVSIIAQNFPPFIVQNFPFLKAAERGLCAV